MAAPLCKPWSGAGAFQHCGLPCTFLPLLLGTDRALVNPAAVRAGEHHLCATPAIRPKRERFWEGRRGAWREAEGGRQQPCCAEQEALSPCGFDRDFPCTTCCRPFLQARRGALASFSPWAGTLTLHTPPPAVPRVQPLPAGRNPQRLPSPCPCPYIITQGC